MASDKVMPLGVGGGFGDQGAPGPGGGGSGGGLVMLVGLLQVLGFAIPAVTYSAPSAALDATAEAPADSGLAFSWAYGEFNLQSPGLAEWAFYLPAAGLIALLSGVLPTRFLRPVLVVVVGAVPLLVLWRDPELQARLLERLPSVAWGVDKAAALKGLALLALGLGGAVIGTYAPRILSIGAALIAAAGAVLYLGVPLPDEFQGGFAWRSSFDDLMARRPTETAWSTVTGHYVLLVAFGLDLLAIGLAGLMCLLSLRGTWNRAGHWIKGCVVVSLATAALIIAGRAIGPLHDPAHGLVPFACELAFNLKMLLATLGIALLLPAGLMDLVGRTFAPRG